jgi:hypothetical protein
MVGLFVFSPRRRCIVSFQVKFTAQNDKPLSLKVRRNEKEIYHTQVSTEKEAYKTYQSLRGSLPIRDTDHVLVQDTSNGNRIVTSY